MALQRMILSDMRALRRGRISPFSALDLIVIWCTITSALEMTFNIGNQSVEPLAKIPDDREVLL